MRKKVKRRKLTLERKDCIECHTSTFSAPGDSVLSKGIKDTKRAACSGESKSLSAIIGAIKEQTGLYTLASLSSVSAKILTRRVLCECLIDLKSCHQSLA